MTTTTVPTTLKQEVRRLLNAELEPFCNDFFNSDFDMETEVWYSNDPSEAFALLRSKQIKVTNVDSYGGEGEGEEYWSVYEFNRGEESVYVKFNGSYQSYDGSTYDEWFFVTPKDVVVTKYFQE